MEEKRCRGERAYKAPGGQARRKRTIVTRVGAGIRRTITMRIEAGVAR